MEYERSGYAHKSHVHKGIAKKNRDEKPPGFFQKLNNIQAGFLFVLPDSLCLNFGKSGQGRLRARKKRREHHQQTQTNQMNEYAQNVHSVLMISHFGNLPQDAEPILI
jgi:hypothetical protein